MCTVGGGRRSGQCFWLPVCVACLWLCVCVRACFPFPFLRSFLTSMVTWCPSSGRTALALRVMAAGAGGRKAVFVVYLWHVRCVRERGGKEQEQSDHMSLFPTAAATCPPIRGIEGLRPEQWMDPHSLFTFPVPQLMALPAAFSSFPLFSPSPLDLPTHGFGQGAGSWFGYLALHSPATELAATSAHRSRRVFMFFVWMEKDAGLAVDWMRVWRGGW